MQINYTTINKIEENIEYYGPFAAALGQIIHSYPKNEVLPSGGMILYKGIEAPNSALGDQIKWDRVDVGQEIVLQGFTSTSSQRYIAMNIMNRRSNDRGLGGNNLPVLLEIGFKANEQYIKINYDDPDYPADEQMILLQDGLTYSILSKEKIT